MKFVIIGTFVCVMKKVPIYDQCSLSASPDTEIVVERLSHYLDRNKDIVFPHRHNFYHFIIFTAGSGGYTIDFERFYIVPWQVYFMIPGQIHTWDFEGEMDGYVAVSIYVIRKAGDSYGKFSDLFL